MTNVLQSKDNGPFRVSSLLMYEWKIHFHAWQAGRQTGNNEVFMRGALFWYCMLYMR